jgi:hypothetical protein
MLVYHWKTKPKEEKNMITLCFLLIALMVLGRAAYRWGANSSDGINSPEWKRRQDWLGFH